MNGMDPQQLAQTIIPTFTVAKSGGQSESQFDLVDLNDIFSDDFFPVDLDFTAFQKTMEENEENYPNNYSSNQIGGNYGHNNMYPPSSSTYMDNNQNPLRNSINSTSSIVIPPMPPLVTTIGDSHGKSKSSAKKHGSHLNKSTLSKSHDDQPISSSSIIHPQHLGDADGGYGGDHSDDDDFDDDDMMDGGNNNTMKKGKKLKAYDPNDMDELQKFERRERNREHAKRSRIRKRLLLGTLQDRLGLLRNENVKLRRLIIERLPMMASHIFDKCTTEESDLLTGLDQDHPNNSLFNASGYTGGSSNNNSSGNNNNKNNINISGNGSSSGGGGGISSMMGGGGGGGSNMYPTSYMNNHEIDMNTNTVIQQYANLSMNNSSAMTTTTNTTTASSSSSSSSSSSALTIPQQPRPHRILMEPDFRLIQALQKSQNNFVLSDPSLPDNPIVYCSEGFCKLTGYKRQNVLGRNCRFLQGPGTDQHAVDIIRQGVAVGADISVCLLNYKADGTPFWNQFFVAALRDSDGSIVNFVGVQCEVNSIPISALKDRVKRLKIPDNLQS